MSWSTYLLVRALIVLVFLIGASAFIYYVVRQIRKEKPFPDTPVASATPAALEKELNRVSVGKDTSRHD